MSDDNFLSRWSRRKTASKTGPDRPAADAVPAKAGTPSMPALPPVAQSEASPQPLPPVESLTFDSDFTGFMKPDVDPALRREALKTLLQDPRFNVMDGLDVYIDDYSKPDPLPDGWLEKLNMVKRLGIFEEPREEAAAEAEAGNAELQKPIQEQGVDATPETPSIDTSSDPNPPSEVGKGDLAPG